MQYFRTNIPPRFTILFGCTVVSTVDPPSFHLAPKTASKTQTCAHFGATLPKMVLIVVCLCTIRRVWRGSGPNIGPMPLTTSARPPAKHKKICRFWIQRDNISTTSVVPSRTKTPRYQRSTARGRNTLANKPHGSSPQGADIEAKWPLQFSSPAEIHGHPPSSGTLESLEKGMRLRQSPVATQDAGCESTCERHP